MTVVLTALKTYLLTLTGLTTTLFTLFAFPDNKYIGVRISFEADENTYVLKRSSGNMLPRFVAVFTARAATQALSISILETIKAQLETKTVVTQGTVTFNAFTPQSSVLIVGIDEGLYTATLRVGVQYAV